MILLCIFLSSFCYEASAATLTQDQQLSNLIQSIQNLTISQRIEKISQALLNMPTKLFPFGEGDEGEFDKQPTYRIDYFDCQSFVEIVLAAAFAKDLMSFKQHIISIRYANGRVNFINRNHFPSIDWIPNNIKNGYITNGTKFVAGTTKLVKSKTFINKKAWYQHLTIDRIKIDKLSELAKQQKLIKLRSLALNVTNQQAKFNYLPIANLFSESKPNLAIFNRLHTGSILMIVRQDWLKQGKTGTQMDISHMGFVIWKHHQLFYRAASSRNVAKVIDVPLISYLKSYLFSPTVRGIIIFNPKELER